MRAFQCCACGSYRTKSAEHTGSLALRCLECNVKVVFTNPSFLSPEQFRWLRARPLRVSGKEGA